MNFEAAFERALDDFMEQLQGDCGLSDDSPVLRYLRDNPTLIGDIGHSHCNDVDAGYLHFMPIDRETLAHAIRQHKLKQAGGPAPFEVRYRRQLKWDMQRAWEDYKAYSSGGGSDINWHAYCWGFLKQATK